MEKFERHTSLCSQSYNLLNFRCISSHCMNYKLLKFIYFMFKVFILSFALISMYTYINFKIFFSKIEMYSIIIVNSESFYIFTFPFFSDFFFIHVCLILFIQNHLFFYIIASFVAHSINGRFINFGQ